MRDDILRDLNHIDNLNKDLSLINKINTEEPSFLFLFFGISFLVSMGLCFAALLAIAIPHISTFLTLFNAAILLTAIVLVATYLFIKAKKEQQKINNETTQFLVNLKEKYNLNFETASIEEFIEHFKKFYKETKEQFSNDIQKVNIALKGIKNEDEEFLKHANLILKLSKKITAKRAEINKFKEEASNLLGEKQKKTVEYSAKKKNAITLS